MQTISPRRLDKHLFNGRMTLGTDATRIAINYHKYSLQIHEKLYQIDSNIQNGKHLFNGRLSPYGHQLS